MRAVPPQLAKFDLAESCGGTASQDALDVSRSEPAPVRRPGAVDVGPRRPGGVAASGSAKYRAVASSAAPPCSASAAGPPLSAGSRTMSAGSATGSCRSPSRTTGPSTLSQRRRLVFIPEQPAGLAGRPWEYPGQVRDQSAHAAGMLAGPARTARHASTLRRPARGRPGREILLLIGQPITTTQLAAVTEQSARHHRGPARVLSRRRAGRTSPLRRASSPEQPRPATDCSATRSLISASASWPALAGLVSRTAKTPRSSLRIVVAVEPVPRAEPDGRGSR